MTRPRKRRSPRFKATVALEAVRGSQTLEKLATRFEVHPNLVARWKRQLIDGAHEGFRGRAERRLAEAWSCREVSQTQQPTGEDELWMMSVLQGRLPMAKLANQLATSLPRGDTERLYWCVTNSSLPYRTRALAILAHKKGIRKRTIWRFLQVGSHYVDRVGRHYQDDGINWFSKHRRKGLRKHELDRYKEAVFAILHSPPSAHGINRTAWRRQDIKKVMSQQKLSLGKNGIDKIIRNAGYKFRKAKVHLTSNDPDYERKVQEITSILAKLRSDERFFSVDEFGPFAVKMRGGTSLMKRGEEKIVPQFQKSKGTLIVTAALELSENQVTHFYSTHKNTEEMLRLLEILLVKHADQSCIYFSWDAASWHASKKLYSRVDEVNSSEYRARHQCPGLAHKKWARVSG